MKMAPHSRTARDYDQFSIRVIRLIFTSNRVTLVVESARELLILMGDLSTHCHA
jgi:hypothetical protein